MNRTQLAARILAFGCLAYITFVTLSPIGLRPVVTGIQTEHVVTFAVVGALFGVGFPKHLLRDRLARCLGSLGGARNSSDAVLDQFNHS